MPLQVFLLVVLGLLLVNPVLAQDYSEDDKASTEAEIAAVKEELAERLKAIEERNSELSSTEQQLRDLEIETAEVAGSLRQTQTKLDDVNAEITESER
ncbi:MAG: murein hydrolase activator EnvC family protein, partial [Pseudomonadota bacterium]